MSPGKKTLFKQLLKPGFIGSLIHPKDMKTKLLTTAVSKLKRGTQNTQKCLPPDVVPTILPEKREKIANSPVSSTKPAAANKFVRLKGKFTGVGLEEDANPRPVVPQIETNISQDLKMKVGEHVADSPMSYTSPFANTFHKIRRKIRRKKGNNPPETVVVQQIEANSISVIEGLKIKIGQDDNTATIITMELSHSQTEDGRRDVSLSLRVQSTNEKDHGVVDNVTVHTAFLSPGSAEGKLAVEVIDFHKQGPQEVHIVDGQESKMNIGVTASANPKGNLGFERKHAITAMRPDTDVYSECNLVDSSGTTRWVVKRNQAVRSGRGLTDHPVRFRLQNHPLPIKAQIRLFCICGIEKYIKPGVGPRNEELDLVVDLVPSNAAPRNYIVTVGFVGFLMLLAVINFCLKMQKTQM